LIYCFSYQTEYKIAIYNTKVYQNLLNVSRKDA
jgi:hypothetical protein